MRIIKLTAVAILFSVFTALLLELGAALIIYHRNKSVDVLKLVFEYKSTAFSTLVNLALPKHPANYRYEIKVAKDASTFVTSNPSPFWFGDESLGYVTRPGSYVFNFHKGSLKLPTTVTIQSNGSRYTGHKNLNAKANIFVFGDSFIFGQGVNDEQTFSALLQAGMPFYNVHLYANGGYSHVNALVSFNHLKEEIKKGDIVVLGYAPFYKVRNVAAPSRLREYGAPNKIFDPKNYPYHLKAEVNKDDSIRIEKIPLFCSANDGYCEKPDPSFSHQNRVTAGIINTIAQKNPGITILLVFEGQKDDEVFSRLNHKIQILYVRPEDFDYYMRDNVSDFDGHPGPYWHYAIYKKLKVAISRI